MQYGTATTVAGRGLSDKAIEWFETRGIDAELASRMEIYSDNHAQIGSCIVFPFIEGDEVVNRKWRNGKKEFRQDYQAKKTLWNYNAIKLAAEEDKPLLITEGEIDALSAIASGYFWAVSAPDGAPEKLRDEVSEEDAKFKFIYDNREDLSKVKRIIIGTDGDANGQVFKEELARRLDKARCSYIEYPEGCKDLNEVLLKHGKEYTLSLIESAKEYPVKGLYSFSDFSGEFNIETFKTGMGPELDEKIAPYLGEFMVVTGTPGSGKSDWVDSLVYNLTKNYHLKAAVASFETGPRVYRARFHNRFLGYLGRQPNDEERARADEVLNQRYKVIHHSSVGDDDDLSVEDIIDLAETAVVRYGINILVIDPWNEIEHKRDFQESETDYVSRAIRRLKRFAVKFDILVIVVAHPVKMSERGNMKKPNLYDISGSAAWYNKSDLGIILWRPDTSASHVDFTVEKIRFRQETQTNTGTVAMRQKNLITKEYEFLEFE